MARRGGHLYEVLNSRARGGTTSKRRQTGVVTELGQGVIAWFQNLVGPSSAWRRGDSGRRDSGRRDSGRRGWGSGGLRTVAIALVGVVAGFAIGRFTAATEPMQGSDLRRQGSTGSPSESGRLPEWMQRQQEATAVADEEEGLSQFGYALVHYPAANRAQAASIAAWLRSQGLADTRIRARANQTTQEPVYGVICYTTPENADRTLQAILALRPSEPDRQEALRAFGAWVTKRTEAGRSVLIQFQP